MLIKQADDNSGLLHTLEALAGGSGPEAKRAATELRNRKAGLRGERDAAENVEAAINLTRFVVAANKAAATGVAVPYDLEEEQ